MRPHIARLLRNLGNLFFDTAERIHPIDNQPLSHRPGAIVFDHINGKVTTLPGGITMMDVVNEHGIHQRYGRINQG